MRRVCLIYIEICFIVKFRKRVDINNLKLSSHFWNFWEHSVSAFEGVVNTSRNSPLDLGRSNSPLDLGRRNSPLDLGRNSPLDLGRSNIPSPQLLGARNPADPQNLRL